MRRKLQDAHPLFADFVDWLLVLDPAKRWVVHWRCRFTACSLAHDSRYVYCALANSPSAEEALLHPFFNHPFEFEPYVLPA